MTPEHEELIARLLLTCGHVESAVHACVICQAVSAIVELDNEVAIELDNEVAISDRMAEKYYTRLKRLVNPDDA